MELEYEAKLNKAETKIVEMEKNMEMEYEAKLNVEGCYFKYYYYKWPLFDVKKGDQMNLAVKHCSSIAEFIEQFNLALALYAIKITAKLIDGKVKLEYDEDWEEWKYSNKLILSPNLAHILGFQRHEEWDENISNGEFVVHFNKKSVQIAPYETDLYFMYPKNLIKIAKRLNEKELQLKDCRDREEKHIAPIKDFDLIYDQFWTVKGEVLGGQMTTMGFDENTKGKMFSLNLKDHTGNLTITAFGGNAEVLSGLAVDGMEYYISNTNDETDMTASINNNAYKIHFETVNKVID